MFSQSLYVFMKFLPREEFYPG